MDNNAAERALRGPVIGRRLSFADSETGARFTAMYSVVGTLAANGIKVQHWLQAWLGACAANGGRPPDDMSSWLPWSMREDRKRTDGTGMGKSSAAMRTSRSKRWRLRALIAGPPPLNRHRLSKAFCQRIGWSKPPAGSRT